MGREAVCLRLQAAINLGEPAEIISAARRLHNRMGKRFLEPVDAVRTLWDAARFVRAHDPELGARLERCAQRNAGRLLMLARVEDRERLLLRLGAVAGLRNVSTTQIQSNLER